MDTAFDNSNDSTLDNLNQDIFQKSTNVLTDGDLDMDIKNTNITSPSIDTLNNIQSYTIDNQKSSEIIDQNRISNDDYIIDENNRHSPVMLLGDAAPLNGKASEFVTSDNYFGPESNVDDDTTGSPVTEELNEKSDDIAQIVDAIRPDELVSPHGIHFESVDYLKTVDEVEECDIKKDVEDDEDDDVVDQHDRNFDDGVGFGNEIKNAAAGITKDLVGESIKLIDAVLPEKTEDPLEDPVQPENAIVPESGEESEDEWNYIKVNQKATEPETQERNLISQETVEPESLCPDLANDNQIHDDPEIVGIEESSLSDADMASQLNPDAKEFVPTSPSPTNTTPINNLDVSDVAAAMAARLNLEDELVAQSPRKGSKCEEMMIDVPVPEENDFLDDIAQRPGDLDSTVMSDQRPGSSSSQCSYQEMNLKEAMHGDEKQEYAPDVLSTPDQAAFEMNSTNGDHEEFINILNKSMRNQDVMNASFYNDGTSDSNNPFKVDLNAVHRLPTSDDENEEDRVEITGGTTYSFEDTEFGMNDVQIEHSEQNGSAVDELVLNGSEPKSNDSDSIAEVVQEMITENMAVLDQCNLVSTEPEVTGDNVVASAITTTTENIIDFMENVQAEPATVADVVSVESENATLATEVIEPVVEPVVSNLISAESLIPEQQPNIVVESETTVEQNIINEVTAEPEPAAQIVPVADIAPIVDTAPIADATLAVVGAAAVAAVATTAAVAVAKTADKKQPIKAADPKAKTTAAKKPLTTSAAAKPKAKPEVAAAKTAPVPRPRTVAPPVKAIEKKTATSTLAAKKPVNGEVKPTTTVPAAKRPVSSTTTLKTTTTARTGAATTTTTTTKVTTSRLTTKPAGVEAPKRVATTKTTTTTTSSTLKPRPSSEKPASTVTRSPISKENTSATDKSTKDTVNKLQTSGARAPVSPRSTLATSRTTTTAAPPKKVDASKPASAAAAPTKRPISSTTRAPVATANSKLAPTQKRPISSATSRSTTLETVKKTTTTVKKDTTKSQTNGTKEPPAPEVNGNGTETNGTHAFDMPIELNNAVNVEQEPVVM